MRGDDISSLNTRGKKKISICRQDTSKEARIRIERAKKKSELKGNRS